MDIHHPIPDIGAVFERTLASDRSAFQPNDLIEYFGSVNYATNERVLASIKDHMHADAHAAITLAVTSTGGPTGTAMSFYDTVRSVLRPRLTTIGMGDVDSSGVIIYLCGDTRYVTRHTTLLLHLAGRVFDAGKRFTAPELALMAKEDRLKDYQYASVLAERCKNGTLTTQKILRLMERGSILIPEDLVKFGLADAILP